MANREHPRYAETDWPEWEFREYPMMVYPTATDQKKPYGPDGKVLPSVIVNSDEELRQAMGFAEPEAEAQAEPPKRVTGTVPTGSKGVSRIKTEEDERNELVEKLTTAGVQFDKAWSPARLQDALDTHEKANREIV